MVSNPKILPPPLLASLLLASLLLALGPLAAPAAFAAPSSDPQNLVDRARVTAENLRGDPAFKQISDVMRQARGVLIVPNLVRAGFFLGGEGGEAVLLAKTRQGWSDPAFYVLVSASFGFQLGIEVAEMVLFVMNDRAMTALMSGDIKLGGQAGVAVATLGATMGGATTSAVGADIVIWSSAAGLYGGLTLDGSVLKPRDSWNEGYYGHEVATPAILTGRIPKNPGADGLRVSLGAIR